MHAAVSHIFFCLDSAYRLRLFSERFIMLEISGEIFFLAGCCFIRFFFADLIIFIFYCLYLLPRCVVTQDLSSICWFIDLKILRSAAISFLFLISFSKAGTNRFRRHLSSFCVLEFQ